MKSIVLEVTDNTLKVLSNAIFIRSMSGECSGITDQALKKIILAIQQEQSTILLKLKEEKE